MSEIEKKIKTKLVIHKEKPSLPLVENNSLDEEKSERIKKNVQHHTTRINPTLAIFTYWP